MNIKLIFLQNDKLIAEESVREAITRFKVDLNCQELTIEDNQLPLLSTKADLSLLIGGLAAAQSCRDTCSTDLPDEAESLAITPLEDRCSGIILVYGADARGLIYALAEMSERLKMSTPALQEAAVMAPIVERPTATVRSISRLFSSKSEDLAWFRDKDFWRRYLRMLVENRFNRFSLTFGMTYNYPYDNEFTTDTYLQFPYPYLLDLQDHSISVPGLDAAERQANLEALQFIARETARVGLRFHLGLWMHGHHFYGTPDSAHAIVGLTEENHAVYCRDALKELLRLCPDIVGVTFRTHIEGGIEEGDYAFWDTLLEALVAPGRPIEIDLHAKGLNAEIIDIAKKTGQPVTISPKYLAEHIGLPYHPMAIRTTETPPDRLVESKWALSEGSRKFLRYSYGDLLTENRSHGILFRIWPGTQRVLMWGDPKFAAAYARFSTFCGTLGFELCEPLSFAGRMPDGPTQTRLNYADASLATEYDWEKYAYTYRLWGRLGYSPDAPEEVWKRHLRSEFGSSVADDCGAALASASRILPLVTMSHAPSVSNNTYWPEIYYNMSIVDEAPSYPYGHDMARPARYGTVGSFDPQILMSAFDFAKAAQTGQRIRKYTPLKVAAWLDSLAAQGEESLERAQSGAAKPDSTFRRFELDVAIQCALGRFFAAKNRSACYWELYRVSGEPEAATRAAQNYRAARDAWQVCAELSRDSYLSDLAYGPQPWMRGRWDDRLAAIEEDLRLMEKVVKDHPLPRTADAKTALALAERLSCPTHAASIVCTHSTPQHFNPGEPLHIELLVQQVGNHTIFLHFRQVDQSQSWTSVEMQKAVGAYEAFVPAKFLSGAYPFQYYFEIVGHDENTLFPGLSDSLDNQPYFVVRRTDQFTCDSAG